MVFDCPPSNWNAGNSRSDIFEQRYSMLLQHVSPTHPYISVCTRFKCRNNTHILCVCSSVSLSDIQQANREMFLAKSSLIFGLLFDIHEYLAFSLLDISAFLLLFNLDFCFDFRFLFCSFYSVPVLILYPILSSFSVDFVKIWKITPVS